MLSLTLINTWLWPLAETEPMLRWQAPLMRSHLMKLLYLRLNLSARVLVRASWGKHRPLSREHHLTYQNAFKAPGERAGTVAFLTAMFDASEPSWSLHAALAAAAPKPTLLLWGAADPFVTLRTLEHWRRLLRHAATITLERVGHFVADEAPELVIPLLERHLQGVAGHGSLHRGTG